MKTSRPWKETIYEKLLFMNITQNHPDKTHYSAKNSLRPINFYCAAPHAKSVELVGDFNHWQPLPMQRSVDGWWLTRIELCHGHHQYRFLVDGRPMLDPHATGIARDEDDEQVSLLAVS
ncbi:MAG TPA: isoamylase early set domain-containing protein [Verrucomicrobiae bacterium]|nr:isoamylase early set domain-containing protein [Verrucomicrobiae bacterium]